jgi:uncharacterized membrane protein YGL010W
LNYSSQNPKTMLGFNFNLKDQLIFYGSYHSNPINQAIHFIFVPLILWTVAIWLAYTPALFHYDLAAHLAFLPAPLVATLSKYLIFDGAFVLLALYSLYYLILEQFAGATWALAVAVPLWATAEAFKHTVPNAWQWALGLHILSWAVQVYFGHTLAEKRRPALLDSFFQSLVLAPLFVWFELLFLLGYRKDLRDEVQRKSADNIAAWKAAHAPLLRQQE